MNYCEFTHIGKKAQVWKSANFDAGLYDIPSFDSDKFQLI